MRTAVCLLIASACLLSCDASGPPNDPAALATVHAAADAMDKAATFEASGTVNLDAPEGFSRDVNTTIHAVVNLQRGASHAEDHSDDGDAWSEIVVDDTFYKAQRYSKARADWCAVPLGSEQQALLQTGSGF